MSGRLAGIFDKCRAENRAALIVYLMAGDPNYDFSLDYFDAVMQGGADIVEIGVPFSDPIADGPVIQAAAERALAAGGGLERALFLSQELRADFPERGLVLMSYLNPLLAAGSIRARTTESILADNRGNECRTPSREEYLVNSVPRWLDGLLPVDLDPDDDESMLPAQLLDAKLDRIVLISDSTPRDRKSKLLGKASGFAYFVAQRGVTGERRGIPDRLIGQIHEVKNLNSGNLPIAVGFGLSRPEDVHAVAQAADGVIVGSALVRMVGEGAAPAALTARVRELHDACQRSPSSNSAPKGGK